MKAIRAFAIAALVQLIEGAVGSRGAEVIIDGAGLDLRLRSTNANRKLQESCNSIAETSYFEVSIYIAPSIHQVELCSDADQVLFGNALNVMLLDYGIGEAGVDDNAIFLAGVCPQPLDASITFRRLRSLAAIRGFVWKGGGGCKHCFPDNSDGRQLVNSQWFTEEFAPQLEATLKSAILLEIAPDYTTCLGSSPQVDVKINEVSLSDLSISCEDGTVIEQLQTLNLDDISVQERHICQKCVSIDFSTRANGTPLRKGDYVGDEWVSTHGLYIMADGASSKARVFDTADPDCVNTDGSIDFGSPNVSCMDGGLGQGEGGSIGQEGENCKPIGNVLVVQDKGKECPGPNTRGGTLTFLFVTPVLISDIGMMDIDEAKQRMKITFADGVTESFNYVGLGDNAVQRIIVNKPNVVQVDVIFPGTGAITEINFCPECRPQATSDFDHHCLIEGKEVLKAEVPVSSTDFENGSKTIALKDWHNGKLMSTENATFLDGNLGEKDAPYKTFSVPKNAETNIFDLDLYKFESLDGDRDLGRIVTRIYIDGERIDFGDVNTASAEKYVKGITEKGILWKRDDVTELESALSFQAPRRTYHVQIQVPERSGLFDDGKLRLLLEATFVDKPSKNSAAGWNNVKVTARYGCAHSSTPTFAPQAGKSNAPAELPNPSPTSVPKSKEQAKTTPTAMDSAGATTPPTRLPTMTPTMLPTPSPSVAATRPPTLLPSPIPTMPPTTRPTVTITMLATPPPSAGATMAPTMLPSEGATIPPTMLSSVGATMPPTLLPTVAVTTPPTLLPTVTTPPTMLPSKAATMPPTMLPSATPTMPPTPRPSAEPTMQPTPRSTVAPTLPSKLRPSAAPTRLQTRLPTMPPTPRPSAAPTMRPTPRPLATLDQLFGKGWPTPLPLKSSTPRPSAAPTMRTTPRPAVALTKSLPTPRLTPSKAIPTKPSPSRTTPKITAKPGISQDSEDSQDSQDS